MDSPDKILIRKLGPIYKKPNAKRKVNCCLVECPTCSKQRVVTTSNFNSYLTTKCNICKAITHNESNTPLYDVWVAMKSRCNNSKDQSYKYYGLRGISVCEEWLLSYTAFRDWANTNGYESGLTIDRKNNNGNYEPSNCRWVPQSIQNANRRTSKQVAIDIANYTAC